MSAGIVAAAIACILAAVFCYVAVVSRKATKAGRNEILTEEQAKALARAQEAQEAERDIETIQRDSAGSAVERLRASKNFRQ